MPDIEKPTFEQALVAFEKEFPYTPRVPRGVGPDWIPPPPCQTCNSITPHTHSPPQDLIRGHPVCGATAPQTLSPTNSQYYMHGRTLANSYADLLTVQRAPYHICAVCVAPGPANLTQDKIGGPRECGGWSHRASSPRKLVRSCGGHEGGSTSQTGHCLVEWYPPASWTRRTKLCIPTSLATVVGTEEGEWSGSTWCSVPEKRAEHNLSLLACTGGWTWNPGGPSSPTRGLDGLQLRREKISNRLS
ncbi:hypothetical protein B0H10DRAFT_1940436 [Mycena sp. CBHHK59/15]|nr:hypothetical protein B0H10DRAFT_1940436 [Mycena sp. CBHHK59/15]